MIFFRSIPPRAVWLRPVLVLALAAAPGAIFAQEEASTLPEGYVGTETCAGCHDEVVTAFKKNRHYWLETNEKRGWKVRSCESCHGPGAKHSESASADDIRNPLKLKPVDADQGCLSCHRNQPTQIGRLQNGHARSQTPCTSCHNVHKTGAESTAVIQSTAAESAWRT